MSQDFDFLELSVGDFAHFATNHLGACRVQMMELERARHSADVAKSIELLDEALGRAFRIAGRDRHAVHEFLGAVALARVHLLLAVQADPSRVKLSTLAVQLEAVMDAGRTYRRDALEVPSVNLRQGIPQEVQRLAFIAQVDVADDPVFDRLAMDRFMRAFLHEALVNVRKHGRGPVKVTAEVVDGAISIEVADGGDGSQPEIGGGGQGLAILEKCARALGGHLLIRNDPTRVYLIVPVEDHG